MTIVNMYEAKTILSDLIKRARAGEEVLIARDGKPVAKLVPIDRHAPRRCFGAFAGRFIVPQSFSEPLPPDELAVWGE